MRIDIEIGNREGKILTQLTQSQLSVISDACMFKVEGGEYKSAQFSKKNVEWDGNRRLFNASSRRFPIGLLHRITELFRVCNFEINIIDKRIHLDADASVRACWSAIEPRDYQDNAVFSSLVNGYGVVKVATGGGKTTIAARTINAIGKRTVFIVHTKDLLYQAKESFENVFENKIGQIGDGIFDPQDITVATVQTLAMAGGIEYDDYKYDEDICDDGEQTVDRKADILKWAKTVGMVLFDEVQRVASRTAFDVRFMFINADNAFGYSASPWRDDGADLMIEGAFGPIITDVSASELIRKDMLVRPTIHIKTINGGKWESDNYTQIYNSGIVEYAERNIQIVNDAMEYYNKGVCTLVLVKLIKHGKLLEDMFKSMGIEAKFISGKTKSKARQQAIKDMRNGEIQLMIASTIADVGLDIPRIGAIIEAGAGKSSVTALQRLGRIMRKFPGKTECHFVTYRDNVPIICRHIDAKIKIWSQEPEFIILDDQK